MDMKYFSYGRTNFLASLYVDIAAKNFSQAEALFYEFERYIDDPSSREDFDDKEIFERAVSTIVFSALTAESFINDYACKIMGDDFFYGNFQSLSTISKLQLCHKIVTGKSIDIGTSCCYTLLKQLTRWRNEFVHNKSTQCFGMSEEDLLEYKQAVAEGKVEEFSYTESLKSVAADLKDELSHAYDSLRAIFELAKLIDSIDGRAYAEVHLFGNNTGFGFSEQVRNIHRRLTANQ